MEDNKINIVNNLKIMNKFNIINEDFYYPNNMDNNVNDINESIDESVNESMCWEEKYAREIAKKYNLKYTDDDSIVAKHANFKQIKAALSELRKKNIPCSDIKMEKTDKFYYILVNF